MAEAWMERGMPVCIVGQGVDAGRHQHSRIARVTKTLIVCENGARFRVEDCGSVPYSPYGGAAVSPRCMQTERL